MRAYKRMSKNATMALFASGLISTGAVASIGVQSFAQNPTEEAKTPSQQRWFMDDNNVALQAGSISETQATEELV